MASHSLDERTVRAIERFLDDWRDETDAPGASVAVFDREAVQYAAGLGARTLDPTAPATADTLYNVGSITKLATAIAVCQHVDAGALALDDPVDDHVPHLADAPGDPVTVHELLAHTSGIPADLVVAHDDIADADDLRRHVAGGAAWRVDDDRFRYYNSGYKVLGELVAALAGQSYATYVERAVLAPLGADRATLDQSALDADADAMTGYLESDDGGRRPSDGPLDFEANPADGGLVASVSDVARLGRCVLRRGEVDGERVLAAELVDELVSRHVQTETSVDGDQTWYGYGLASADLLDDVLLEHGGVTHHAHAYVGVLRDRGLGVAVAFNRAGVPQDAVGRGVLALVVGEPPTDAVPALALREKLDALAGTYDAYRGAATATVARVGGHLRVDVDRFDDTVHAFPESTAVDDRRFYTVTERGDRVPVRFAEIEDGLSLHWRRARFDRRDAGVPGGHREA